MKLLPDIDIKESKRLHSIFSDKNAQRYKLSVYRGIIE